MPLTTLDTKSALIIVDLRKGIVGDASSSSMQRVVEGSRALIDAFRAPSPAYRSGERGRNSRP